MIIGQDYVELFPGKGVKSTESKDDLYFLKSSLLPGEVIYGEAAVNLLGERRKESRKKCAVSRGSSNASACREPDGGEHSKSAQVSDEKMQAIFGSPVSSSSYGGSSSSEDRPYDPTKEVKKKSRKRKWKKEEVRKKSPSRSEDRNGTMSEVKQQPKPSTSKATALESMAAERDRITKSLQEHDRKMKLEEQRVKREAEEDKKRRRAEDKNRKEEKDKKDKEDKKRKEEKDKKTKRTKTDGRRRKTRRRTGS
jgi:hypothetical protein